MRKFLIFLTAICITCCSFGAVACGNGSADGHNWSNGWTSDINRHWHKCLDAGCNLRSEYEDHDWVLTDTYVEATCGEAGGGQYTCSDCKATLGNRVTPAKIPASGNHRYKLDSLDVKATCGEDGYGSYICEVCYDFAVLPIPATGDHDYSGALVGVEGGHYHDCLNGCGIPGELEPHVKGEGIRHEPVGMQDGRIEYRCTECNYILETVPIPNPNVLDRFEVKFVRANNKTETATPVLGDDGEWYVTLKVSSNANSGYTLEFTGYSATGNKVNVPGVQLYYYDEYTGDKKAFDLGNIGSSSVGYMGYLTEKFYITRETEEDVSLLIECTSGGRGTVSLKVHIKAVS